MPRIRIEWVPVQHFGLGLLGFDHLQLVYQPDDTEHAEGQDAWFVMEGVREATRDGAYLGIEGADGRTTLSVANLAAGDDLIAKIGTPEYRGSRALPYAGDGFQAWETMTSYARDIESQDFPYIAYGLPGSPTPTINSSSAIASLLYYSGLDPSQHLPHGIHLSPGTGTLLGTSSNDAMRIEGGFTTLLGGHGRDELKGGPDSGGIEKLYGGADDDLFHWSSGFNVVHGGQPYLPYEADGTDVMDYSGAGVVRITFNRHWVPHKVPNYVAAFDGGLDHLYSIERIQWNEETDRIELGRGVGIVEDSVILAPSKHSQLNDTSHLRSGQLVSAEPAESSPNLVLGTDAEEALHGTPGDDTLYGGAGDDRLAGGAGSDGYVYLPGDGNDVIVDAGPEADIDELHLAGGITPADISFQQPAHAPDDIVLVVDGGDRILIQNGLAADGSGIDRIVFDHDPAWTREDLQRLVADDTPSVTGSVSYPVEPVANMHGNALSDDETDTSGPLSSWPALDAHVGWLF
jgi:Ca2+-binding RTX toxin-like protein